MSEELEVARNRYHPERFGRRVILLFVCESPPSVSRFFYFRNSVLYFATFCAFSRVFGVGEPGFLDFFAGMGCYVYDLFEEPGKRVDEVSREELFLARERLAGFLRRERPRLVVVTPKRVAERVNVRALARVEGFRVLPFPRGRFFTWYVDGLAEFLETCKSVLKRV